MAAVARELAGSFRVLEPWQRGSGAQPLTVGQHIADLHEVVQAHCPGERPALVGSSWGAMLALAYAAAYPAYAAALALIGCGTFDLASRRHMRWTIAQRIRPTMRDRMKQVSEEIADADERMKALGELIDPVYSYEPLPEDGSQCAFDARSLEDTWADMERLQAEGVYPAAFSSIRVPVLMLHGAYDPHPGRMIHASLQPHLPQLEYMEWKKCGHYPWRERYAREEFFTVLREWLRRHGAGRVTQLDR
jgi:pimeloyl-ACP methyl ester carboxylesterase